MSPFLSYELSSARFPRPASMMGEGARLSLRPLNPQRLEEKPCRRGLPSLGDLFVHLQLRVSLHAERDCQAFHVHSHLRRSSLANPQVPT